MGVPEGSCYLMVNSYHQKGDKKPCLTSNKVVIDGVDYKVAVWPPKPGKTAYYMRIDKIEDTNDQESQPAPQNQEPKNPPPPKAESNPTILFK